MTQREKLLAACVGVLLLLIVAYFTAEQVVDAFKSRDEQISKLESEINSKQMTFELGTRAAEKIAAFEARSLPAERGPASSHYRAWLVDLTGKAGLDEPTIKTMGTQPQRGVYEEHKFQLTTKGSLDELTEFLYGFYAADIMHRIRMLSVLPDNDSKDLRLTFYIDAGSLPTSPNADALSTAPSNRLKLPSLDDYNKSILERNLFGPPNNPPRFASTRAKDAYPNQSYSAKVDASDPDGDKLSYELVEGELADGEKLLPEASVSSSGTISGKPTELGEYYVTVRVTDDGTPSKSVVERIRIPAVEPPVETPREDPPKFDSARLAKLTGITRSGGRSKIWISLRNEGRLLVLHEGDRIDVGSVSGVVAHIDPLGALIDTEGKRLAVSLGDFLADAEVLPSGE